MYNILASLMKCSQIKFVFAHALMSYKSFDVSYYAISSTNCMCIAQLCNAR